MFATCHFSRYLIAQFLCSALKACSYYSAGLSPVFTSYKKGEHFIKGAFPLSSESNFYIYIYFITSQSLTSE